MNWHCLLRLLFVLAQEQSPFRHPSGRLHTPRRQLMCMYRCWLFASSISGLARRMYTAVRCTSGRTQEEQDGEPTRLLGDANRCSYTRPLVGSVPPSCVSWSRVCSVASARICLPSGLFSHQGAFFCPRGRGSVARRNSFDLWPWIDLEE